MTTQTWTRAPLYSEGINQTQDRAQLRVGVEGRESESTAEMPKKEKGATNASCK